MLKLAREGRSTSWRHKSLWLADLGWITALFIVIVLKMLNYSQISFWQIGILFGLATLTHLLGYLAVRLGLDRKFSFDPHFVFVPNWLFFAPLTAYGYYAVGDARDVMLVGWFMGLLFLVGYVGFTGVILTACWYMTINMGLLSFVHALGIQPVDLFREAIRSIIFLVVCTFFAFHFDRYAAHKDHLKSSLAALREKDRVITLLNEKLAKYVTTPVLEQLAKEESSAVLTHERRKVTVFFSDIQDFSIISDALEPEELAQLLNEYFAEMIHIVLRFGGTLDKLMGDGMMVLFGAPVTVDPAAGALRCVQMAVNMQERLSVLNDQWRSRGHPYPLKVRMGVNTGLNTVGSFGSDAWLNYTAIGAQVNIASRLEQMAEPGQILMTHSTYALVADCIEVEKLGETSFKGSQYPIQLFKLVRLIHERIPVLMQWQGFGYSISVQPDLLTVQEKDSFLQMLEKYLGKHEVKHKS